MTIDIHITIYGYIICSVRCIVAGDGKDEVYVKDTVEILKYLDIQVCMINLPAPPSVSGNVCLCTCVCVCTCMRVYVRACV